MFKTNWDYLYQQNYDPTYTKGFKQNFQYPKHCLKLVEKSPFIGTQGEGFLISFLSDIKT